MKEWLTYQRWLWGKRYFWLNRPLPDDPAETCIYEGLPRSGKSLHLTRDVVEHMRSGGVAYSNTAVRDVLTGRTALPCSGWLDVMRICVRQIEALAEYWKLHSSWRSEGSVGDEPQCPPDVLICLYEIQTYADARAWQFTPQFVLRMMEQRGHYGVALAGDTQHLEQLDKRLRNLVGRVVHVQPHPLRRIWRRLPLFRLTEVDMRAPDPEGYVEVGKPHMSWVPPHGFHSYATHEIMASMDFASLKDEAVLEEVAELTERAVAAAGVEFAPTFADELFGRVTEDQQEDNYGTAREPS